MPDAFFKRFTMLFKKAAHLLLFGNIYVSAGAYFLVESTRIQCHLVQQPDLYPLLVFFASLFVYNFQRIFYRKDAETQQQSIRRTWIGNHQGILILLSLIGMGGVLILLFFLPFILFAYLSPLLLLSLAYFVPGIKLRQHPWMKLFTLVSVWTIVTALVPLLLENRNLLEASSLFHLLRRWLFIAAICLPFDIRDMHIDARDGVRTVPLVLNEKRTRYLATFMILLFCSLLFLEIKKGLIAPCVFDVLLITSLLTTVIVMMSTSKRSEYFYVAGIDGTMILQGAALMLCCHC